MPIDQIHIAPALINLNRKLVRLSTLTLFALSTSCATTAVMAANNASDANARYQAERAVCMNGQSNQDRATCLKEAGAALQEAKAGHLNDVQGAYTKNAMSRCEKLPADDRDACMRRMSGEGTITGSAQQGGIERELIVPDKK